MVNNLTAKGRKLVTIVDPHMKRDSSFFFHQHCEQNDFYVKDKDGKIYEGWCWPGSSSYPDFFNPAVRDYWASRFALDKYEGERHLRIHLSAVFKMIFIFRNIFGCLHLERHERALCI